MLRTLVILLILASGCSHVRPYEREYLAQPGMDKAQREAKQRAFAAHVLEAREGAGALGMADASGGGCGCN